MQNCRIILIETHYPGNLGAAARVMRNFGLRDLVLVSPIADRNDTNARQMSTHGESILDAARVVADLGEAISDCVLVVGTSGHCGGAFRRQNVGTPVEIMPLVAAALDQPVALLFGSEPNGLSNEVIARCQYVIQIPTAEEYGSLNLAQAVAICLYELKVAWLNNREPRPPRPLTQGAKGVSTLANLADQERMFQHLRTALEEIHFLYGDKAEPLLYAVRHLLGKARLSDMEVKILLGLARQIRWYVANHPDKIA